MIHIVVLGGGYGGLAVIKQLLKKEPKHPFLVTLVDRQPFHGIKTDYYALAAGTLSDYQVRLPFPKNPLLKLKFDEVKGIRLDKQVVELANDTLTYDYLVIALGSEDRFDQIRGSRDYAKSLQSIEDTRKTSEALLNTKPYGTVKIVGGGLTGVELASELRESRMDLNINLYERGSSVLKPFSRKIQVYVKEWFKDHDIQLMTNSAIDYIGKHNVYRNGKREESDLIIWAAGVQPSWIVRALPVAKDGAGRLKIDSYNRLINDQKVFAIGDCSSTRFPPSAQVAQQQGDQVGLILRSLINGKQARSVPALKSKGTLGTLGQKVGFGEVAGIALTGSLPRLLKKGVEWWHVNRS